MRSSIRDIDTMSGPKMTAGIGKVVLSEITSTGTNSQS